VNKRVILIVLDSVGCGALPDACCYGDEGCNTLANIAQAVGGLNLPNLQRLGLGNIREILGVPPADRPQGAYGKMVEQSCGKDTTTGHWEIAGIILSQPFPTYPKGFPPALIKKFESRIGTKVLGNIPASGTEIIKILGEEHMKTGYPIVYTSADSVFQIAAHEKVIPLEKLYDMCRIARELLNGKDAVARVIARPFDGEPGKFFRTAGRHDYSLAPPGETMLDIIKNSGKEVVAVGKINDIFTGKGITRVIKSKGNKEGIEATYQAMDSVKEGLIFTNLVDFDMLYGHRNDPTGYAQALEEFDKSLPGYSERLRENDLLVITADHGADPTTESTDHSREYVPILITGPVVKNKISLGTRKTFADVGATVVDYLEAGSLQTGTSMLDALIREAEVN
jgi:phosphopentomutase